MNRSLISIIASPFVSYFQATIGLSCSSCLPEEDFSHHSLDTSTMSKKALEAKKTRQEKYSYRPRKTSFSLIMCIQKQREMTSPRILESQDHDGWLEEELILAATPHNNTRLLQ